MYDKLVLLLERWSSDSDFDPDLMQSRMYGAIVASYEMGVISLDKELAFLRRYCGLAV